MVKSDYFKLNADGELYDVILTDFTVLKEIGSGSIGTIYKAVYIPNNVIYSLKVMEFKHSKNILYGLKISHRFIHLNTMKSYGYFYHNHDGDLYIIAVLEYIEGEDLHDIYSKKSNLYIRTLLPSIMCQAITGLNYIHSFGLVHRDIKLENIVVNKDNIVKIIDYDFLAPSPSGGSCGTPYYISPETINNNYTDQKSDIWSIGVVIYTLLTGDYPFDGEDNQELYENILSEDLKEHLITKPYRNLLTGLLRKNPKNRISLTEAYLTLKDL